MKYTPRHITIDAVQVTGPGTVEGGIPRWLQHLINEDVIWLYDNNWDQRKGFGRESTYEDDVAEPGDYIIKLPSGVVTFIWGEIFEQVFEPAKKLVNS